MTAAKPEIMKRHKALLEQRYDLSNRPAQASPHRPITRTGRLEWFAFSSFGPASLAGGVVSAAWGTMLDKPREYGPHWQGFGQRYGMRLTGVATGNAMEAGLGAIWSEDPRYPTAVGHPFRRRVGQIVKMTFLAQTASGATMPAYARYVGTVGNNFLSNTWRESSESDVQHALERVAFGFLGRMASNAFAEFWPSVQGVLRRNTSSRSVRKIDPLQNTGPRDSSEWR